ncbi:signal peptidase I [Patescibacteria group bacterium]|nr:signal peptidase I [Patescibacteria group bacterium]
MRLTPEKELQSDRAKEDKKDKDVPSFVRSPRSFFIELIKIVLIAVAVIIPIRYFLFQPFYVRGASMEPNFHDNEYLIIDEISYRFNDPQRGEVVVIKDPKSQSEFLIKRIIGLPEEKVEIKNGQVIIYNDQFTEGVVLFEEYLPEGLQTNGGDEFQLSQDQYYVLGDNRPVSLDSRNFGALEGDNIVGRAWLRVWPFNQFQQFSSPEYNYNLSSP